ncbi:MAG: hypothetical protein IJN54_10960 [Lachnospiraceae bacterium]|nr:hypothetical protein [Lachnospiraceae bacterium]
MKRKILAVCDSETEYTNRMQEFLCMREELPFEVYAFTDTEKLEKSSKKEDIEILLISESDYSEKIKELPIENVYMLNESGHAEHENVEQINKYQSSEKVLGQVLEFYSKRKELPRKIKKRVPVNMIGVYSPVGRCLQTSFALAMGQILAKKHKVLYLNFESFSGLGQFLQNDINMDLTDLLYYYSNTRERFRYRLESSLQTINGLYFVPPAVSFMDLQSINAETWIELLMAIEDEGMFEYIILDLSDCVQGLLELLRKCSIVYTILKEDNMAVAKIRQYEELLADMEYQDILDKTKKQKIPHIRQIAPRLEQVTYGELGEYVRGVLREDMLYE